MYRRNNTSLFLVNMPRAIEKGKLPGIQILDRSWNDDSNGVTIIFETPLKVRFLNWIN